MGLVDQGFALYLSRITPPQTQMEAAQRSHNALRAFLECDCYFGRMIVTTFLNGSYARGTVVRPIKDVDVIVVVGPEWLRESPAKAMEALRRKLSQRYPERRTLRQRRAVRVTLYDMQLDVLLAVAVSDDSHPLRIPDRRMDRWIETHPKLQLELTSRLKSATAGNYSKLVRLLKGWSASRVAARDRPSSFVLECAAYHVIARQPGAFAAPVSDTFVILLDRLREWDFGRSEQFLSWGRPGVPDPALPRLNVAERWDSKAVDRYRARLDLALKRCADLPRSRWEETEVEKWRMILGEPFAGPIGARR